MAAPNLRQPTSVIGKTGLYSCTITLADALSNVASSGKVFKINSAYCANVDGVNSATVDLSIYDGVTDYYIAFAVTIPAKTTQVLIMREAYVYLEEGESLRARASAAGDLQLVIGYEEIG